MAEDKSAAAKESSYNVGDWFDFTFAEDHITYAGATSPGLVVSDDTSIVFCPDGAIITVRDYGDESGD